MSATIPDIDLRLRYFAKAKQYFYDRGKLDIVTDDQSASTADYLRYQDFRAATEPYVKQKERLVNSFFSMQLDPLTAQMPEWLEDALAQWDEMIAMEAKKFGYDRQPSSAEAEHGDDRKS